MHTNESTQKGKITGESDAGSQYTLTSTDWCAGFRRVLVSVCTINTGISETSRTLLGGGMNR